MILKYDKNVFSNNCRCQLLFYKDILAAKSIRASSCNILQMIFLSANSRRALAIGVDGFHRNQCIIMQQEFARELGEISPSVCFFGVDAAATIIEA